ncbi:tetratricopeptide repeat protein [Sphingomonas sp. G-3-2-10]|uniref:tetratricopeptide repeat protein n=1 Tax=Sphingomonas sp. G-3-2-10 TaxID=2728838 RepID=UPI00146CDEF1|nr:tetratricopeptide repeat protein [Sphingomonas sp. G-3-2-10]
MDTTAYVRARAADERGDAATAVAGYAAALKAAPDDPAIALYAYRQALAVGDYGLADLAERALAKSPEAPVDAAILRYSLALKAGDRAGIDAALGRMEKGPLEFMVPVLRAWIAFDRGEDPFPILEAAAKGSPLTRRYAVENRALLLVAMGRSDEGLDALRAILRPASVSDELRVDAAHLLGVMGKRNEARELLSGDRPEMPGLRSRVGRGAKPSAALGSAWLFINLTVDLAQEEAPPPISILLTRAALLLDPTDDRSRVYLADALSKSGMADQALGVLNQIRRDSPFASNAAAGRIAALNRAGKTREAIALAKLQSEARGASSADAQGYGDLLAADKQYAAAATAYGVAIGRGGESDWNLHYQRGVALDRAGRWAEALPLLRRAVALSPREAQVLSYLGSALISRGENLEEGQYMLERASRLRPGDAAITDALGWAYYTRGDVDRALPLIERAAQADPGGSQVNEHLGDIYWKLGRHYEARYAWKAAALYADDTAAPRIAGKIANGLDAVN